MFQALAPPDAGSDPVFLFRPVEEGGGAAQIAGRGPHMIYHSILNHTEAVEETGWCVRRGMFDITGTNHRCWLFGLEGMSCGTHGRMSTSPDAE